MIVIIVVFIVYLFEVRSFHWYIFYWYISLGICLGAVGSEPKSNPQPYRYCLFNGVGGWRIIQLVSGNVVISVAGFNFESAGHMIFLVGIWSLLACSVQSSCKFAPPQHWGSWLPSIGQMISDRGVGMASLVGALFLPTNYMCYFNTMHLEEAPIRLTKLFWPAHSW